MRLATFRVAILLLLFVERSTSVKSSADGFRFQPMNSRDSNCLKCACMGIAVDESYRKSIVEMNSQKMYSVLYSDSAVMGTYMMLTGLPLRRSKDADKMCVTSLIDMTAGKSILLSRDINLTSSCSWKTISEISEYNIQQKFDPSQMPDDLAESYKYKTSAKKYRLTWTDGVSAQLYTSCGWDGQTIWEVWSTKKKLSLKVKRIIMKHVKAMGFDPAKSYSPSYKNCK